MSTLLDFVMAFMEALQSMYKASEIGTPQCIVTSPNARDISVDAD